MRISILAAIAAAAALVAPLAHGQARPTAIECNIFNGDGSPVNGTITIANPSFLSLGAVVEAGSEQIAVAGGQCFPAIALVPTDTAVAIPGSGVTPQYTVFTYSEGVATPTTWLVPTSSAPVTIASIVSSTPPNVLPSEISTAGATSAQVICANGSPLTAQWCNGGAGGGLGGANCAAATGSGTTSVTLTIDSTLNCNLLAMPSSGLVTITLPTLSGVSGPFSVIITNSADSTTPNLAYTGASQSGLPTCIYPSGHVTTVNMTWNNATGAWVGNGSPDSTAAALSAGSLFAAAACGAPVAATASQVTSLCSAGTSSVLGCVKPDGSTISNSAGSIACATATTGQLGCVKPDGTSVTISGGVISASGGGGGGAYYSELGPLVGYDKNSGEISMAPGFQVSGTASNVQAYNGGAPYDAVAFTNGAATTDYLTGSTWLPPTIPSSVTVEMVAFTASEGSAANMEMDLSAVCTANSGNTWKSPSFPTAASSIVAIVTSQANYGYLFSWTVSLSACAGGNTLWLRFDRNNATSGNLADWLEAYDVRIHQ